MKGVPIQNNLEIVLRSKQLTTQAQVQDSRKCIEAMSTQQGTQNLEILGATMHCLRHGLGQEPMKTSVMREIAC